MSLSWFRVMALVVAMSCAATATVSAQSVGTISGTVKDESGAATPGVVVTARNQGTGAVREVVTDDLGGPMVVARVVRAGMCRAEDIIDHCARNLAPYKVPRQIEFCEII